MRNIVAVVAVIGAILVAGSGVAHARDVYLNGVKLERNMILKNQTFPACEVKFDENGDVFITAKGFKLEVAPAPDDRPEKAEPPPADGKLTKRYWLVSKQTKRGAAQYDIDVFVNDVFVKKVRSADDATVLEVTKHVKPGANKVRLIAVKNLGDKRVSSSPVDVLELVLGEGNVGGGTVTIDKPVVTYKRAASESDNFKDEMTFTGR
jgi:hypothetical protein